MLKKLINMFKSKPVELNIEEQLEEALSQAECIRFNVDVLTEELACSNNKLTRIEDILRYKVNVLQEMLYITTKNKNTNNSIISHLDILNVPQNWECKITKKESDEHGVK